MMRMEQVKRFLRKTFIILLAAVAAICSIAFSAIFGRPSTRAEERALNPCDGSHSGYTEITSTTAELSTGNYYLTQNVKLDNNLTIAANANVTICLNGYILYGNGNGSVISITSNCTVDICDCKADSSDDANKHYYTVDGSTGRYKFTDAGGNFLTQTDSSTYIVGGVITGGNGETYSEMSGKNGGGIFVYNAQARLNLYGGSICGNIATGGSGGGLYLYAIKKFTMSGGSICGNAATKLSDESGGSGGGIWLYSGEFEISGGSICGNSAEANGGGICVTNDSSLHTNTSLYVKNIEIKNNKGKSGGGIHVGRNAKVFIEGTVIVDANKNDSDNNNVYLFDGATLNFSGVTNDNTVIGIYPVSIDVDIDLTQGYSQAAVDGSLKYFKSDNNGYRLYIKANGEVSYTNKWALNLNLYKNGDNWVTYDKVTTYEYVKSKNTELPKNPTRFGYKFEGWYNNESFNNNKVTYISAGSYGDKTFYAKWSVDSGNDLFGGGIRFGKNNLWDCQRSPVFPIAGTPFYIYGLRAPLDVKGNTVNFADGDYVSFVPYNGVTDTDGNGVITVAELNASDRDRIADTMCDVSNTTGESAILNSVVVSEVKFDSSGRSTVLANIGLIWALGEKGFLYTALDPDCGWSNNGGVGTFVTFDAHKSGDSLQYTPDSSDPTDKNDFLTDDGGNDVLPVPTPGTVEPTGNTYSIVGIVVDGNGNALHNTSVALGGNTANTDGNGYFAFDDVNASDGTTTVTAEYGSHGVKSYVISVPSDGRVTLVYPLDGGSGSSSTEKIYSITYKNMDGATFGEFHPLSYVFGTGAKISAPTKPCYAFGGWFTSADFGGDAITAISASQDGNVTLYAKWTESHSFGEYTVVPPTCTDKGSKTRTCSICGKTETEELAALGHSWGEWVAADENEVRTCSVCGATETRAKQPADVTEQPEDPEQPEKKSSLLWLIILLAAILVCECVVLGLRLRAKKKKCGAKMNAMLPLFALAYPIGEVAAVAILGAAVVAVGVAIACTFIKKKELETKTADNIIDKFEQPEAVGDKEQAATVAVDVEEKKEPEAEIADNTADKPEQPEAVQEKEQAEAKSAAEKPATTVKKSTAAKPATTAKKPAVAKPATTAKKPAAGKPKTVQKEEPTAVVAVSEEVRREIEHLDEVKKANVTVEEAKKLVSDAAANALVAGKGARKTGKKFAVNIDTLSEHYKANETVDMASLKSKGIVPKSVKQIKILARGMLDKPLCVIADDFSADAVKMIVLTGGEARLQD